MRYIKVLSMFVILAVALLLISTIRTYAGAVTGSDVALIQCDGDLLVVKAAISNTDGDCNDTGGGADCALGDPCDDCLEECIESGYSDDIEQSGSGKITFVLTGSD